MKSALPNPSTAWELRSTALLMFSLTACILAFEIAVTRVCSVLLQYHLIFAVVSFAVLGIGLGGFVAYLRCRDDDARLLALGRVAVLALAPAMLVTVGVLVWTPFATYWPVLLLLVLPPFFCVGMFQSIALRVLREHAGVLYAADLVGGGVGAVLVVPLLNVFDGPLNVLLLLGAVAAVVAAFWVVSDVRRGRVGRLAALTMVVLAVGLFLVQWSVSFLDIDYGRAPHKLISGALEPGTGGVPRLVPELQRWDAYSRVDVVALESVEGERRLVFIDGETPTVMLPPESYASGASEAAIRRALPALPYRLRRRNAVLSVGSGGGYDVVLAKSFAARRVDAVEINAGVLEVVEEAREFTGDVYGREGVQLVHGEGRQFVRTSPAASYDLVILLLAQSLAGNLKEYALSENYLYTREAFEDYFRVLSPGGSLAILVNNHTLLLKLARTALEVLDGRGVEGAECMALIESPTEHPYDRLLVVQTHPFEYQDLAALGREAQTGRYKLVHFPAAALAAAPQLAPQELEPTARQLKPATDDRPFFFHVIPGLPVGLLRILIGALVGLLAAGAFLLVSSRRAGGGPGVGAAGYFVLLGLAFLMVEVIVLQKAILLLSFPTVNLAVVLATFLMAAGLGSAVTSVVKGARRGLVLRCSLLLLAIAVPLAVPYLEWLQRSFLADSLTKRCFVVSASVFPLALLMGMPFPLAVRLLPAPSASWVPWLWGLNGVASVMGSALVVALALKIGFRGAAFVPAVCYLCALPFVGSLARDQGGLHAKP